MAPSAHPTSTRPASRDRAWRGPLAVLRAGRLLASRRDLWPLCAVPVAFALVAALAALGLYVGLVLDPLLGWLSHLMSVPAAAHVWEWLWLGPLHVLAWLARVAVALAGFVAVYLTLSVLAAVAASPFLDALSRAVEVALTGDVVTGPGGLGGVVRSAGNELRRLAMLAAITLAVAAVGLLPLAQPVALALGAVSAAGFLALEHTAIPLDRREIPLAARRRWIWRHRFTMLGFGATAAVSYLVPGLNLLCLPLLTVAGTLLAVELDAPRSSAG